MSWSTVCASPILRGLPVPFINLVLWGLLARQTFSPQLILLTWYCAQTIPPLTTKRSQVAPSVVSSKTLPKCSLSRSWWTWVMKRRDQIVYFWSVELRKMLELCAAFIQGGCAVDRGTALQTGRSRVRFPILSLEFFIDITFWRRNYFF